jgi:hypothetical protein
VQEVSLALAQVDVDVLQVRVRHCPLYQGGRFHFEQAALGKEVSCGPQ